jgi:hypothetical protein
MLQEHVPDFFLRKIFREIDAEDLGAERSRDTPDFEAVRPYCSTLMFWALMIEP